MPFSPACPHLPFLLQRRAACLRQESTLLFASLPPGAAPGPALYRLLRTASSLELYARLLSPAPFAAGCELNSCAAALVQAVRELCPLRREQLSFFPAASPLPVGLSASVLSPLLCHLACNSLQQSGREAQLCLKTGAAAGRAYVYLSDNGPGLGPSFLPGASPGLGLACCRLAAQRAGGSFLGWNLPRRGLVGGGAAVVLALPLISSAPACPPFFWEGDRFSPFLVQLSPCCILPDQPAGK